MRRSKHLTAAQKARRERIKTFAMWTGLGLLTYETYLMAVVRRQRTRDIWNQALQRAHATGKKIVVIGDPDGKIINRVMGRDYDCGDICIDVRGCSKCPSAIVGDPYSGLSSLSTGANVVFVAPGQLERAKDPEALWRELKRVAGADLFVAHYEKWSLASLIPPSKRRVFSAPPDSSYAEWRELPWQPGKSEVKRLAGLYTVYTEAR